MPDVEPGTPVYRIGPTGRIRIDVAQGSVRVEPVEGDECWVAGRYTNPSGRSGHDPIADGVLRVRSVEGGLVVTVERSTLIGALLGKWAGSNATAVDVTVNAPRSAIIAATSVGADVTTLGMVGEQAIRTVTGDVSVSGAAGLVKVDSISGRVTIQGSVLTPKVSTTSGDVTVRAEAIDEARIDAVSADIDLEGRLAGSREHRIGTINGDLSIASRSGFGVSVRAVSGSIRSQVPMRREDGTGQRRVVVGDGRAEVAFQTVSGDLILRDAAEPAADAVVTPVDRDNGADMRALLESLERGEIDVDEASQRLEATRG